MLLLLIERLRYHRLTVVRHLLSEIGHLLRHLGHLTREISLPLLMLLRHLEGKVGLLLLMLLMDGSHRHVLHGRRRQDEGRREWLGLRL